jgi:ATP-binding cassette subfamily F protein 3
LLLLLLLLTCVCHSFTAAAAAAAAAALQAFIDKFRYNAKRASLVQSRIKALERMAEVEVTEKDPEYVFTFPEPPPGLSAPIIGFHDVSFNYPGGPTLFRELNFGLVSMALSGVQTVLYVIDSSRTM